MDADDVRVAQAGQHARLAIETLDEGGIPSKIVREDFQRDEAVELRLAGFVHRAHAAGPDEFEDFELGEMRSDFRDAGRSGFPPAGHRFRGRSDPFEDAFRAQTAGGLIRDGIGTFGTDMLLGLFHVTHLLSHHNNEVTDFDDFFQDEKISVITKAINTFGSKTAR
jgi:hypothetical protein